MKYYCGLDVSLNNTAICIVNHDGDVIRESEVPTEPSAIDLWLKSVGLPLERVGLEAGGLNAMALPRAARIRLADYLY